MPSVGALINRWGGYAGSIVAILGVATVAGFSLDPPWAAKAEVKQVQDDVNGLAAQLLKIGNSLECSTRAQREIQRVQLRQQLREARADLAANPNSVAAAQQVEDLRETLAKVDAELAKPAPACSNP